MTLSDFVEGLNILLPHYTDPDKYHIGAEHDMFYAYTTDTPLSDEEYKKMTDLEWFQENGIPEDGGVYLPDKYWMACI